MANSDPVKVCDGDATHGKMRRKAAAPKATHRRAFTTDPSLASSGGVGRISSVDAHVPESDAWARYSCRRWTSNPTRIDANTTASTTAVCPEAWKTLSSNTDSPRAAKAARG